VTQRDVFRPPFQPARRLYDAFQRQARNRDHDSEWQEHEAEAVWREASEYARMRGLQEPTLQQVKLASEYACGHVDYGSKWAIKIVDLMGWDYERE